MKIDLTVSVQKHMWTDIFQNERMTSLGHLGTHFDVMNKEFSLENTRRNGKVVDVSQVKGRDISVGDLGQVEIEAGDFILFYTGFLDAVGYGTQEYFKNHPQLAMELIELLLEKRVSLIGIDAAGVRRGGEHTPTDQYCADRGVFIIENVDHLDALLALPEPRKVDVYTFPIKFEGMTGLPCRVIAEV